jgi:hydrogenase maturation protease
MASMIVCGLGNPYVSDDGVGVLLVRELARRMNGERVSFTELTTAAFDVLSTIAGYNEAVLIDVAQTANDPPGTLRRLSPGVSGLQPQHLSLHSISFQHALALGAVMGLSMPHLLTMFTIEGKDTSTFHEGCTQEVLTALPAIADTLEEFVREQIGERLFPGNAGRPATIPEPSANRIGEQILFSAGIAIPPEKKEETKSRKTLGQEQ